MDARLRFRLNCSSPVTAFSYHPIRRELITGHEDGLIKCWDIDTGRLTLTLHEHQGMVTDFFYWSSGRLLLSSSVDGMVIQWSPSGAVNGSNEIGRAAYSLCWYPKLSLFLVGCVSSLAVLKPSDGSGSLGLPLLTKSRFTVDGHTDIINCLKTNGNRIYSAGYDRSLCVYDVSSLFGNSTDLPHLIYKKRDAHNAGITCLKVDQENDWVFTGSFDRQVKIWSSDIKLIHTLQFLDTVTSVAFIPNTKVLWVTTNGSNVPFHFEPKSGDKISDYLDPISHSMKSITANSINSQHSYQHFIQHLDYIQDTTELIGITSSKEAIFLKYNYSASVCCQQLPCPVECLTYTHKVPILLFTGTDVGTMIKWERLQLNPYMYSKEELSYSDYFKKFLQTDSGGSNFSFFLYGKKSERGKDKNEELSEGECERAKIELMKPDYRGFVKSVFVESLDMLISSSRDGKMFIWSFDAEAAKVLRSMDHKNTPQHDNGGKGPTEEEEVTYNRVAGLICQHILNGHNGPVQALAIIENQSITGDICLLSGGWDLSICIWNLNNGKLMIQLHDVIPEADSCHDDLIITDIAYNPLNNTFAFSASNSFIYLMSFSLKRSNIKLLATLKGHTDEVTRVLWNPCNEKWVTGSEDGTICIWSSDGLSCDSTIDTNGPVAVLCIDQLYKLLIVGVRDTIKVYNEQLDVVQVYQGHNDKINGILYIPELSQYVSISRDNTLRVWNSFKCKDTSLQTQLINDVTSSSNNTDIISNE